MNEKDGVASHYIVTFYNDILAFREWHSQYINLLVEIKHRHGEFKEDVMSDEEKNTLINVVQQVRHHCTKLYFQYKSILKFLNNKSSADIDELYKTITKDFVIKIETINDFANTINSILVDNVMDNLLITGTQIYNQVYSNANQQPKETGN